MKVIDPGHNYMLDSFDGGGPVRLTLGTQIQEVLRALIERCQYVNKQFPSHQAEDVEANLANSIWLLEQRHCERHGKPGGMQIYDVEGIDLQDYCKECGHIVCFCPPQEKEESHA